MEMRIILQWKKESASEVTQLYLTLYNPMDCSLPSSSVHGIIQARILERVAISFSRGSSWLRDQTLVSGTVADALPSELPGIGPILHN